MPQINQDKFEIRPAKKSECRPIAQLFSIASDGVSNFSYRNVIVAAYKDKVIGMLVTFPMVVDKDIDHLEEDPVLVPFSKLDEDNSLYVCGVALLPGFRGSGIGSKLMAIAEKQAKEIGLINLVSLFLNRTKVQEVCMNGLVTKR